MRIYIKKHNSHAGKWIYQGYKSAWEHLGYDTKYYSDLNEIEGDDYYLMVIDADVNFSNIKHLHRAKKVFLYAQPNKFPLPWGAHPNFVSLCPVDVITEINKLDNVHNWCFGMVGEYHERWDNVLEIPLAFDSINYEPIKDESYEYDVCFVGGWADNGFNEKKKIMLQHFGALMQQDLKCGIFINKNLSHEQENKLLYNSKVALNIHDNYQRVLSLDTNERTFKSLGLNGVLLTDRNKQIDKYFSNVIFYDSPKEMVKKVKEHVTISNEQMRQENRELVRSKHTYIVRARQLEDL